MYKEPYCRFTSQDYDPAQVRNKFAHLCNACVNNLNPDSASSVVTQGKHQIVHNMWEASQFQAWLQDAYSREDTGLADPWTEKIWPQLKAAVIYSVLAVRDQCEHRHNSHELFGYDFMVDEDLNVWLIEVNSSPSMDYSAPTTEKLVKQVLKELPRLILEGDNGRVALDGDKCTDRFEMVYHEGEQ